MLALILFAIGLAKVVAILVLCTDLRRWHQLQISGYVKPPLWGNGGFGHDGGLAMNTQ